MDGVTFSTSPNTQSGDTNWLLAWSVMAGAGFQLSERVILDLGYRFIDMGKAESDTADTSGSTNNAPWGWTTLRPRIQGRPALSFRRLSPALGLALFLAPDRRPGPACAGPHSSVEGPIRLDLTGPPPIYVPPTLDLRRPWAHGRRGLPDNLAVFRWLRLSAMTDGRNVAGGRGGIGRRAGFRFQ